jgi:hypothetical protein
MFSDDFGAEAQPEGDTEITLRSFFKRIAASIKEIFAAKHSLEDPDQDALGDHVAIPDELKAPSTRTNNKK